MVRQRIRLYKTSDSTSEIHFESSKSDVLLIESLLREAFFLTFFQTLEGRRMESSQNNYF
jgi:hypothetical protein